MTCDIPIAILGSRAVVVLTSLVVTIWMAQHLFQGSWLEAALGAFVMIGIVVREIRVGRKSRELLGSVLDAATEIAVVATNTDGRITIFNKGAESMLGYRADQMVGIHTLDRLHESSELDQAAVEAGTTSGLDALLAPPREGKPMTRDWTYVRRDGRTMTVSLVITTIRERAGRVVGFLGIAADVTAKREQEREQQRLLWLERELTQSLAVQNDELVRMDRTKDEFVATVSHEFRTPLTSIRGYLETLLDEEAGPINDLQGRFLHTIERNADRLGRLVEDLLFAARIDAGGASVAVLAEMDLAELILESAESAAPAARAKHVDLQWEVATGLPVAVDPARMSQLIDNLLNNAIKFTPEGGQVRVAAVKYSNDAALFTVTDTGIGIPLDEQPRLFRRFFRSRLATEHAINGTGIGLAIVKEIAEAHGASVQVESTPGTGTTFSVLVPLVVRLSVV